MRKVWRGGWGSLLLLLCLPSLVIALGTTAGTSIANRADISYEVNGQPQHVQSNEDRFLVDRIVDIRIDWMDSAPVEVSPGESDRVLRFLLSNLGNADQNVTLSAHHDPAGSFTPPPQNVRIFRDSNLNGTFDPGSDLQVSGMSLAPDANATLFLVADMPDPIDGNRSLDGIRALSDTNATAGADRPGEVDVVVRRGASTDYGEYRVRDYYLQADKSATAHSADGALHTGTVVTYRIDVSLRGGAGGFDNVVFRDSVPDGMIYQSGSITLDGTPLSDVADADAGEYDSANDTVVVTLGTLSQSSPGSVHRIITFDAKVP
jgi:fimbrial isopeptide formation D2 family protein